MRRSANWVVPLVFPGVFGPFGGDFSGSAVVLPLNCCVRWSNSRAARASTRYVCKGINYSSIVLPAMDRPGVGAAGDEGRERLSLARPLAPHATAAAAAAVPRLYRPSCAARARASDRISLEARQRRVQWIQIAEVGIVSPRWPGSLCVWRERRAFMQSFALTVSCTST